MQFRSNLLAFLLTVAFCTSCAEQSQFGSLVEDDREQMRTNQVRESMQRLQIGAEHYAADHGTDNYPLLLDDSFKAYMPGGDEASTPSQIGYPNVFTGTNKFPTLGSEQDYKLVLKGERIKLHPGEIRYCPLNNGKAYAVIGGGSDGKAIMDIKNPGKILILSNLED
ncbi:MAG: hypothetical protein K2X27_08720 [Candidatus Obscuribacterales bacterium]|nr:hypothetical protein [Candidatus Obscuribacterales bacterium]